MSSNRVFNSEALQQGSCASGNNVISNLPEKMKLHGGKVVDGDLNGHGGSLASGYVQQNLSKELLEHPLLSSNPNIAIVLSIAFLQSGGRGVVGDDGEQVTWTIPNPCSYNTLQLVVQNNGNVYLVSERERGEHRIFELEFLTPTMWQGKNVIRVETFNVRGLLVYPELTCLGLEDGKPYIINTLNGDGVVYDMRNGHGDSRASIFGKQFFVRLLKGAGAMCTFQKIFFAMAVCCNIPQVANAQQLTSNGDPADPAPWLTSDTAKVTFVTALFAGGVGAAFIWKRFFRRPLTFSVDAGLEASPAELGRRRSGLDSVCPRIDEC